MDLNVKVPEVVFVWDGADTGDPIYEASQQGYFREGRKARDSFRTVQP